MFDFILRYNFEFVMCLLNIVYLSPKKNIIVTKIVISLLIVHNIFNFDIHFLVNRNFSKCIFYLVVYWTKIFSTIVKIHVLQCLQKHYRLPLTTIFCKAV